MFDQNMSFVIWYNYLLILFINYVNLMILLINYVYKHSLMAYRDLKTCQQVDAAC